MREQIPLGTPQLPEGRVCVRDETVNVPAAFKATVATAWVGVALIICVMWPVVLMGIMIAASITAIALALWMAFYTAFKKG